MMTLRNGAGRHRRSAEAWQQMTRELADLGAALAEEQSRLVAAAELITHLTAERDALREAAPAVAARPLSVPEQFRHGVRAARQGQ